MTKKPKPEFRVARTIHVSASSGGHIAKLCPSCETIMSLRLVLFSTSKRTNGLFWVCNTLNCGFREKFTRPEIGKRKVPADERHCETASKRNT